MEPKKSKYDTNPLDPDFVRNAEQAWGEGGEAGGPGTQEVRGATREIGSSANENARSNIYSEAPTRRYDNPPLDAPYLAELPAAASQLVFIMGCHRSGTSMLYHLLAYTGQLDYISAYDIIKYDELLYNRITGREDVVKADLRASFPVAARAGGPP